MPLGLADVGQLTHQRPLCFVMVHPLCNVMANPLCNLVAHPLLEMENLTEPGKVQLQDSATLGSAASFHQTGDATGRRHCCRHPLSCCPTLAAVGRGVMPSSFLWMSAPSSAAVEAVSKAAQGADGRMAVIGFYGTPCPCQLHYLGRFGRLDCVHPFCLLL